MRKKYAEDRSTTDDRSVLKIGSIVEWTRARIRGPERESGDPSTNRGRRSRGLQFVEEARTLAYSENAARMNDSAQISQTSPNAPDPRGKQGARRGERLPLLATLFVNRRLR
jgi:hypothetical protein